MRVRLSGGQLPLRGVGLVAGGTAAGRAQGTAATEAHELWDVYGLEVRAVPTNRPTSRIDYPSRFFPTPSAKLTWIARMVRFLRSAPPAPAPAPSPPRRALLALLWIPLLVPSPRRGVGRGGQGRCRCRMRT